MSKPQYPDKEQMMRSKISTIIACGRVLRLIYIIVGVVELIASVILGAIFCLSYGVILLFPFIVAIGVIVCILSVIIGNFIEAMIYTYAETVVNVRTLTEYKIKEYSFGVGAKQEPKIENDVHQIDPNAPPKFCTKCGLAHSQGEKFCSKCGNPLN